MRSHLFGVSAGAFVLGLAGLVNAGGIGGGSLGEAVDNPGFENPALDDGQWNMDVLGWTTTGIVGTWNPTTAQFPADTLQGENVAWIAAGTGGAISQAVGPWEENEYYVVSVEVGNRADVEYAGYVVQLVAGGVVVAEDVNTHEVAAGEFALCVLEYEARQCDSDDEVPLEIRLSALSATGQVAFDNVSIEATPLLACDADLDCDGAVGFEDIISMLNVWGDCGDCLADLDDDNMVDFTDVLMLLTEWGPCPEE